LWRGELSVTRTDFGRRLRIYLSLRYFAYYYTSYDMTTATFGTRLEHHKDIRNESCYEEQ
jgi:hypothetical protein